MSNYESKPVDKDDTLLGSGEARTSILIADDHLLLAEAVASALQAAPRFYKTMLTSNVSEVMDALASGMHFDLVLLDVRMPGMFGLKSIIEVIKAADPAKVCLISGEVDRTLIHLAVEKGALGLIPKTMSLKSLVSVVEFVMSGQIFIPANENWDRKNKKLNENNPLNETELRIVRLTSEGMINKEIAAAIGTSEMMVKMHMRSICSKLTARNRAHAVTMCREYGLL